MRIVCKICNKEFENKKSMTNHRRNHFLKYNNTYQNKNWLFNQYKELKKPISKIADICNCCIATIYKWINIFKFEKNKRVGNLTTFKKGHISWNKGLTKESDERLKKMGELHKGKKWFLSDETKKRMSESRLDENNGRWKGNNVGYKCLHDYIRKRKEKTKNCNFCNQEKRLVLSSKTHEYTRNLNEYQYLCYSCHAIYDIKNNLRGKRIEIWS